MQEVAERKLAEAHSRYQALQDTIADTSPASEAYQRLMKESAALLPLSEGYQQLQRLQKEAQGLAELASGEGDSELAALAEEELAGLQQQVRAAAAGTAGDSELAALAEEELAGLQQQVAELRESLLLALLPPDSSEDANVVLELRASVGGEWVVGFAEDLLDMYRSFAGEQGWRFEVLESKSGDSGGIKSATALISGPGAFGQLRWESGVHRVTMVPSNSQGKMQTGTTVVIALPEASEVEVSIADTDLRIETCRASGKGGQHVNTTDSAVRVVHLPTGIAVSCQNERSQGQNRSQALRVLRAKLYEMELQKHAREQSAQRKAAAGNANTNERIRSYNYQDGRVVDHRVGLNINIDVPRFMEGGRLGEVIAAVKLAHQQQLLQEMLAEG
ncbi:hypothetical protein OEZ86_009510 [Tetradesmus obliquus]|uniref:Prokaryotic-type class I peptide chain release factors domain-containing protein n=1 Tax=Tetradesmus obliquus TaxID=3088 RepID=A0ABY8UQF6_TETOB|nr:hypothetical protein OEZ85_000957 [Tetradesmus obliquus]WIA42969.1 hypothetical protein OEZ86_009510 [Tetradesmus obliquus]